MTRRYIIAGIVHVQAHAGGVRVVSLCGKRHLPSRSVDAEPTCPECLKRLNEQKAA